MDSSKKPPCYNIHNTAGNKTEYKDLNIDMLLLLFRYRLTDILHNNKKFVVAADLLGHSYADVLTFLCNFNGGEVVAYLIGRTIQGTCGRAGDENLGATGQFACLYLEFGYS